MAYIGPLEATDPAKTTPLATVTGAWAVSLLGFAVDHKISPEFAFIATHPPAVVVWLEGFNVKLSRLLLAMFVYTLLPSVAAPHCPPPSSPPGPANYRRFINFSNIYVPYSDFIENDFFFFFFHLK
jgi:hypothetical protein